ncbi:retropepsin-like aspartic protease [Aquimarina agarilytica]|uniref:retropepsin-like aspartic protease n=1 Tax=Aquimarina agarilytica TaxID=1087449 RepID=UPI000289BC36|nr:aspartyl protease family protein [Aquimarina agarilytica]
MKRSTLEFLIISLFFTFFANAQKGYQFVDPEIQKYKLKFELISNMIVIPVVLNGTELTFILDTGASSTLLFNTTNVDSLNLKNIKKRKIKGLGSSQAVETIHSNSNVFKIGELINPNQSLELILDKDINFSGRLGIPIHGIIGCDLFTNFTVAINYSQKFIKFYKPEAFNIKKVRNYEKNTLQIFKKRLYVNSAIVLNKKSIPVKMLLDTGAGDTVWLLKDSSNGIDIPEKNFEDYMGRGIGGDIFGKRSRLDKLSLGKFNFYNTTVSFPDSTTVAIVKSYNGRNGSICAKLLKRFNLVINTSERAIYLKKNHFFKDPFEYNMSGIEIEHSGKKIVSTFNPKIGFSDTNDQGIETTTTFSATKFYKFELVPIFEVAQVRKNSPAFEAGIKKGDVILSINNKSLDHKKISEISEWLSSKQGKRTTIIVERNGGKLKFQFNLKRML